MTYLDWGSNNRFEDSKHLYWVLEWIIQPSLLKGHRKQLSLPEGTERVEKFIILFQPRNKREELSRFFHPTRKRYIILNPKVASKKPIKEKKVFLKQKLWSRCSNKRRHYSLKLNETWRTYFSLLQYRWWAKNGCFCDHQQLSKTIDALLRKSAMKTRKIITIVIFL